VERCSWTDVAKPSLPMWGGAEFSPSLSEGMSVPKAVGPPLVEKVRLPRCCVSFTHKVPQSERERLWSLDIGNVPVRLEKVRLPRCCVSFTHKVPQIPHGVAPSKPNALVCCSVPGSRVVWFIPPRVSLRIGGPCPPWPRVVGSSLALGTRLQSFGYWWSWSCPGCWAIIDGPRYPGYKTPTGIYPS
jgi:hypothetical protein